MTPPLMFDAVGEPVDARDVLDPEELGDHLRAKRERANVRSARRRLVASVDAQRRRAAAQRHEAEIGAPPWN